MRVYPTMRALQDALLRGKDCQLGGKLPNIGAFIIAYTIWGAPYCNSEMAPKPYSNY